jgi:hypothetical protein
MGSFVARMTTAVVSALLVIACSAPLLPESERPALPSPLSSGAPTASVPNRPSPPSATPSPAVRESPTVAAPPSDVPALAEIRFERVANFDDSELHAAAAFDGGFVVGGCRLGRAADGSGTGCADARILHSTHGRTWTDASVPAAAGRSVLGLAVTPLGLLAFGSDQASGPPRTRSIWNSSDGVHWSSFSMPAPRSIVFNRAFVLGGRTLLIGEDSNYDFTQETEVWATTDGRRWKHGETPSTTKVAGRPGLIAIGDACIDLCPDDLPIVVHRTHDGFTWREDPADPAFAKAHVFATASWAGRAMAAGTRGSGASAEGVVWIDEFDGWQPVRLDDRRNDSVGMLIDVGDRMIAVGSQQGDAVTSAWSTVDGRGWKPIGMSGNDGYLVAWAGTNPLIALTGYRSIAIAER